MEQQQDDEEARRPNPFPFSESEDVVLDEDYVPTKHDVVNGRGRKSYNHIANRRFRQLIAMNLTRYLAARCKVDKTLVVVGIVNTIRNATPAGGFLKKCPKRGRWVSMSDESAREKVGHCLRDMIASQRDDKKVNSKGAGSKSSAAKNNNSSKAAEPPTQLTAMAAATSGADSTPRSPHANPWLPGAGAARAHPADVMSLQHPINSSRDAPFANMWNAVKNEITANEAAAAANNRRAAAKAGLMPPLTGAGGAFTAPDPPPTVLPMNLNNLDTVTLQKGNLQDMSEQQRKILIKLEGGFKGSVEELMEAVNC